MQRLQAAGHTVGMAGDGVNDAPALRRPRSAVVAGATDVAKSAAGAALTRHGPPHPLTIPDHAWPQLDLDHLRSLVALRLLVSSQATIYLVRTPDHAWTSRPGGRPLVATAINIAGVFVLALTGTLMASLTMSLALLVLTAVFAGALIADLGKAPFNALGLHRLWRRPAWVPTASGH